MSCLSSIFDRGHNKPQSYNDDPLPPELSFAPKIIRHASMHAREKAKDLGQDPTSYPVVVDTNACEPAALARWGPTLTHARGKSLS